MDRIIVEPGEKVCLIPLERAEARVVGIEAEHGEWVYVCRYFHNGEAKTARFFEDEIWVPV